MKTGEGKDWKGVEAGEVGGVGEGWGRGLERDRDSEKDREKDRDRREREREKRYYVTWKYSPIDFPRVSVYLLCVPPDST